MSAAPPSMPGDHVLIVGGGFSGTLLAVNLLRHDGPRATLVERRPDQMARGVAYSAADDSHLLNVRAGNMSAFPDDPGHFVRWLAAHGEADGATFVRRTTYGRYLADLLAAARAAAGDRLRIVAGEVAAIDQHHDRIAATFADGMVRDFDRAVLAIGNLPPHAPPGVAVEALSPDVYSDDPWSADIARDLGDADHVLLLGSGLTAIDAALLLDRRGFRGRITAMSRRGLRPRGHVDGLPPTTPLAEKPARALSALVRSVREASVDTDWRCAVDAVRPVTQLIWSGADLAARMRFLRHLRPFWDVHRHRLAPDVAQRIKALVGEGRLAFRAGKLSDVCQSGEGLMVTWRPRGQDAAVTEGFRRLVNCTGPQGDLMRSGEPLVRQLVDRGTIRPDQARLGIDIDADTRTIARGGGVNDRLHAVGPMTRGAFWEVVAVPDIRVQAWTLARAFANAHWVGGEGL